MDQQSPVLDYQPKDDRERALDRVVNWVNRFRRVLFALGFGLLASGLGMCITHIGRPGGEGPAAMFFGGLLVGLTFRRQDARPSGDE